MAWIDIPNLKKNSVHTTIASPGIDADDTTIPVAELSKFHDHDGNLIKSGIVIGYLNSDDTITEEITITGASGTSGAGSLTGATRGVNADGSIGAGHAWTEGTEVAVMVSLGTYNILKNNLEYLNDAWSAFDATPIWPDTEPTISTTVARYVRNGNLVTFAASYMISEGNDAESPSIPLPVATSQIANFKLSIIGFKKITSGGTSLISDPFAYIDFTEATPVVKFHQFGTLPSGYTAELNISGSYEVAT
jgi:hypothetical protein